MKKISWILMIAGAAAVLLSLVLAFAWVLSAANDPGVGIIGGADTPTFWFIFNSKCSWLAWCGGAAVIAGLLLRLRKK